MDEVAALPFPVAAAVGDRPVAAVVEGRRASLSAWSFLLWERRASLSALTASSWRFSAS